jgi:hypothetical protein
MKIREDFLQYLWRMKQFDLQDLQTTTGEPLQIIAFGEHNSDAGPDFLNAKIHIGDTLWAGNVEIHTKSSEWLKHKHQDDAAYNNVILHVVYENDKPISRSNGELLPCLELRRRIPPKLINQYLRLTDNEHWIPCQALFATVSDFTKSLWIERLLIERLERRTANLNEQLAANDNNWEATFYEQVARSFGAKVNAEPFEHLAKQTPLLLLAKHKNDPFQMEALLFGQAGFLDGDFEEAHPQNLQKEYTFLKQKYNLQPLLAESWRFLRLRPANFPTVRIAQFAALVHQSTHLFSKVLAAEQLSTLYELLDSIETSEYWLTHYKFDKPSAARHKKLGKTTVDLILINTVIPFLFFYGRYKSLPDYETRALDFLEELAAESNQIVDGWKNLKLNPRNAYETQALLELKRSYCDPKRCLNCAIGNQIMKNEAGT